MLTEHMERVYMTAAPHTGHRLPRHLQEQHAAGRAQGAGSPQRMQQHLHLTLEHTSAKSSPSNVPFNAAAKQPTSSMNAHGAGLHHQFTTSAWGRTAGDATTDDSSTHSSTTPAQHRLRGDGEEEMSDGDYQYPTSILNLVKAKPLLQQQAQTILNPPKLEDPVSMTKQKAVKPAGRGSIRSKMHASVLRDPSTFQHPTSFGSLVQAEAAASVASPYSVPSLQGHVPDLLCGKRSHSHTEL